MNRPLLHEERSVSLEGDRSAQTDEACRRFRKMGERIPESTDSQETDGSPGIMPFQ